MITAPATFDRYGQVTIDVNGKLIQPPKGMPMKSLKKYINNFTPGVTEPVKIVFEERV